nr:zinc finger protein 569-like isoform X2 [Leptinotarsa decemlineata]
MEEQEKTCVICLQNYTECESFKLIPLSTVITNNESLLNKIHCMASNREFEETWEICPDCSKDLNKTWEFRKKLITAVAFWKEWQVKIQTQEVAIVETSLPETCINGGNDMVYPNKLSLDEYCSDSAKSETDTFVCGLCLQLYQSAADMLNHSCSPSNNMKNPETVTYPCDLCGTSFTSKSQFKYHSKTAHAPPKSHLCTICNKAFKHSHNLREHLTTHTRERNYHCDICNKTFHRLSSQNRHKQTHKAPPGEKTKKSPFLCSICGKNFPYSNGFQRHMRTHFAEKPHQCNICNRAFSQSTHLKVHLRTHSGERPFICSVCKSSFSLKATLRKHMKGHKDSEDYVKMVHTLEPNLGQTKKS